MAKRFATYQKEAAEKGYSLQQKGDHYYAEFDGIKLDDEDLERLVLDIEAVKETSADDSPFTLEEEPDDEGNAIITFEGQAFKDPSIAEALRQAKEAKLAKEKPAMLNKPKRSFGRKAKEEAAEPANDDAVEPWQDPKPNGGAHAEPGMASPDRTVILTFLDELAAAIQKARNALEESAPKAAPISKPRVTRSRTAA